MPTREALLTAVAGKGVERGLTPENMGDYVVLRYPAPQDERQDNLHKQSIRSLIGRIAPDWKIHISSIEGEGFSVEVRPKPGLVPVPPAPAVEVHEAVEPGPTVEGREIDLTNAERLEKLAKELGEIAKRIAS